MTDYEKSLYEKQIEAIANAKNMDDLFAQGADWGYERGKALTIELLKYQPDLAHELAEAKAVIETMADLIESAVYNFECDRKCQCCMNNKNFEGELRQAITAYEKWKAGGE